MCVFTEHVSCAPQGIIGGILAIVLSKNKKNRILVRTVSLCSTLKCVICWLLLELAHCY